MKAQENAALISPRAAIVVPALDLSQEVIAILGTLQEVLGCRMLPDPVRVPAARPSTQSAVEN